jgi:hypothetical protein
MTVQDWSETDGRFDRKRILYAIVGGAGLFAVLLWLFARAMARELNHDEHQFVAPSVLLLREGLLPYRDYPFFHTPNLVFVFAPLFAATSRLLFVARLLNVLCAGVLLLLVFAIAAHSFRALRERRWVIALGFVLVLSLNPFFRFTAGRAWNHDLPTLASVAAFVAVLGGATKNRSWLWIGLGGFLLGIAAGTRLSFLPLLLPFAFLTLLLPPRGQRLLCLTSLIVGTGIALLPTAILAYEAPRQFLFGNFTYNSTLNPLYRRSNFPDEFTWTRKFAFPVQQLLKSPSDLALVAGFIYFGLRPWRGTGWRNFAEHREALALAVTLPWVLLGSIAATPSHRQYYYPLVPFLLLGNIYGIAREGQWRPRTNWLIAATLFASLLEAIPDLSYTGTIARPAQWPVFTLPAKAEQIRELCPQGRVLTLAPIVPLEANLQIYPELATGPFGWRTAAFVDQRFRALCHVIAPADLNQFLQSRPPAAILTGFEHSDIELPLVTYARTHGYVKHSLDAHGALWLIPTKP